MSRLLFSEPKPRKFYGSTRIFVSRIPEISRVYFDTLSYITLSKYPSIVIVARVRNVSIKNECLKRKGRLRLVN